MKAAAQPRAAARPKTPRRAQATPLPADLVALQRAVAAERAAFEAAPAGGPDWSDRHPILGAANVRDPEAGAREAARVRLAVAERRLATAEARRKRDLALIHQVATRLRLDEATYRAAVSQVSAGRTDSAGALLIGERDSLIEWFRGRGWKPYRPRYLRDTAIPKEREAVAGWLRALLLAGGYPDSYADAIAAKRWGMERWEWCGFEELTKLAQMLQIHTRRRAARGEPVDTGR